MQRFEVTDKLSGLVGQHGPFEAQKEYTERKREMQRRLFGPGIALVRTRLSSLGLRSEWTQFGSTAKHFQD
jgi:hypothetical protein